MTPQDAYRELVERSRQAALLDSCASVLSWEEHTYMPPGGSEHRSNQLGLLAGLTHEKRTDPRIGELLNIVENTELTADPLSVEAVNIREWRREFDLAVKLPKTLVEELAKVTSQAQHHWAKARKEANFPAFQPWLERIVELKRQQANALGFEEAMYDALLDQFEPGARTRQIASIFEKLRNDLVPLVSKIVGAPKKPDAGIISREYPVDRQRIFGEAAAAAIGFDFRCGRLDSTVHPFCSGFGPGDTRITTRYCERDFNDAFFSILHEAGHGMYEQGLDPEHYGTPMGEAVSLGIHESQSRMWENEVGRSRAFWQHFFPRAKQVFYQSLHDVSLDDFHFAVNQVEPSFIRVDADEVTYNLHVMVRFELEQALIKGDLPVSEVPAAWNKKYQEYLGITPPDDTKGCLQDVHWSAGLFGYFPTYTLGNVFAAQLFEKARVDLGDLDRAFAAGEFAPLLQWLRTNVHRQGKRRWSTDLIQHVTGNPIDHRPLIGLLNNQYAPLYGVD